MMSSLVESRRDGSSMAEPSRALTKQLRVTYRDDDGIVTSVMSRVGDFFRAGIRKAGDQSSQRRGELDWQNVAHWDARDRS